MKYVSGRIKELKVGISSYSEDKTPFSVVGNMDVIGIISATTVSISTTTDVASEFVNINVAGISTFNGEIDSNGRIVGAATSNVIPFLYSNYSDLPSAGTYHGAFAHVHATQRAYFAHGGAWYQLINQEANGTVGTGTEKYDIGITSVTNLRVAGISTYDGDLDVQSSVLITGITTIGGLVDINAGAQANTLKVEDLTDNRVVIAGTGGELEDDANLTFNGTSFNVGSAITMYQATGIVSATSFFGDGSGLENTGATLSAASGSQRLVLTSLTSGTMTSAATDADLSFDAASNLLSAGKLLVSGISTFAGLVTINDTLQVYGNVTLGSNSSDRVTVNAKFNSDLHPSSSSTYDLGNGTGYWKTLWVKNISTNAAGIATFNGHTELNTLNATGISTFSANAGPTTISPGLVTINPQGANHAQLTINSTESGTTAGPVINLVRDDGSPQDNDYLGIIKFNGSNSAGQQIDYVKLSGKILDTTDTTEDAAIEIKHYKAGSETVTAEFNSDSLQLLNGTNFSVAGNSTFTGNIDANGGADIAGGLVADTAKISDLTNTRVVYVGASGELQDSANLTFNGTALNGTFTGDGTALSVTIPGISTSGTSEFTNLNVSGIVTAAGAVFNTARVTDLTDNRIVIAGNTGELEDTSKLTFDGTTLAIVGNATFTGNVSVAGTLTSEDKTNIDSIGIVTARTGVRISSGGLVVASGVSTFTDAIDANGGITATTGTFENLGGAGRIVFNYTNGTLDDHPSLSYVTGTSTLNSSNLNISSSLVAASAKVSDLTSGRVVYVGTAGELQDLSTFTFNGSTVTAPAFSGDGSALTGITAGGVGAIGGLTVKDEGVVVGTAGSISTLDFLGGTVSVIANTGAAGIATVTVITEQQQNIQTLNVTGVSTFNNNVHLLDNDKLLFGGSAGTHDGLEIYHDGSNSYISDSGTGALTIEASTLLIENAAGNQNMIQAHQGGAVNLYYANSKKFETTNTGVEVTGDVTATNFNSTSDARLKTNVQTISSPLEKLNQIDGVSFDWVADLNPYEDESSSMGVIADTVEKVLPVLVAEHATGYKSVNYNGLIGLLIEAVKEQQVQITELKSKLDSLS